jgi:uncharacterized protein
VLSFDTNILFHAVNAESPCHEPAAALLRARAGDEKVAVSELVLVELYGLLRNPAVYRRPLDGAAAVRVIQGFRQHPKWRLLGFPSPGRLTHDRLWAHAARPDLAFRRIFDVRLALSLLDQGVTELATANRKDFEGLGFLRVWNPVE